MNIAFVGRKHSGKSTAAAMAVRHLSTHGVPAAIYSFAAPIKRMREVLLDSAGIPTPENKEEPIVELPGEPSQRKIEQVLGTEAAREHWHRDFWLGHMKLRLDQRPKNTAAVIDDVRFPNELAWARRNGFHIVWIQRPSSDFDSHPSEQALADERVNANDWVITNDDSLVTLETRIEALIDQLSKEAA